MIAARVLLTMFLAIAAPAAGSVSAVTATPGQAPDATLPAKCSDQRVAPASVVILCGDAGVIARDLVWHDWGAPRTSASGTASVNTCDPSCAAGNREEHPIVVVADRLVDCTYGRPQYTRITYSLPDRGPGSTGSGATEDRIKETRRFDGRTLRAHRTRELSQTKRCQWHALSWKPRPELLAAGTYLVAATVWEDDGQGSKTVSREITATG